MEVTKLTDKSLLELHQLLTNAYRSDRENGPQWDAVAEAFVAHGTNVTKDWPAQVAAFEAEMTARGIAFTPIAK